MKYFLHQVIIAAVFVGFSSVVCAEIHEVQSIPINDKSRIQAVSPDFRYVVLAASGHLFVLDLDEFKERLCLYAPATNLTADSIPFLPVAAFTPDSRGLVVGFPTGELAIYDLQTLQQTANRQLFNEPFMTLNVGQPLGKAHAALWVTTRSQLVLIQLDTLQNLMSFPAPPKRGGFTRDFGEFVSALHPDSPFAAVGDHDNKNIRLYDLLNAAEILSADGGAFQSFVEEAPVRLRFRENATTLSAVLLDVNRWDGVWMEFHTRTSRSAPWSARLPDFQSSYNAHSFSSDCVRLVVEPHRSGHFPYLADKTSGAVTDTFGVLSQRRSMSEPYSIAISDDGKRAITAHERALIIWSLP